jgi:hypothetical protein
MEIEKKRLQTMFPNLSREMEYEQNRVGISSIRSDAPTGEKASSKCFDGYIPDVIDFIRRCDNEQQAVEIIDYLERRHEIGSAYAKKLKKQTKEKGVRSFGSKKQEDYYSRKGIV